MQLLRASEVEITPNDQVFYYSRLWAAVVGLVVLCGGFGFAILGWQQRAGRGRYIHYYIAGILLLGLLFLRRYITARFRPTNWLVRMTPTGLFIKFRSYLNYHLPEADEIIVFVSYSEIRSARLLRQRTKVSDSRGHPATQTTKFVEFDLSGDATAVARAVKAETARPAPGEKHWYGTTSTLYRHYPVRVVPPSFLQVQWSVVPGWRVFLTALRPYTTIAPPLLVSEDFANLVGLSREEQEQRLRELDARGQTVAAVYTARQVDGYNLTEAISFIDSLRTGKGPKKV